MGCSEHVHAQTGLTDAAAEGLREFASQQGFVERELSAFHAPADFQLTQQGFGVNANAHRGQFVGGFQNRVPDDDVAVESDSAVGTRGRPVVVVRSAAVVNRAVRQSAADADDENRPVFLAVFRLTLFGRQGRILFVHLFGCNKRNLFRQKRRNNRELGADRLFACDDAGVNLLDGRLEGFDVAFFRKDDLAPVPLVNVERMDIIQIFVGTNGVHVGVQTFAGFESVTFQSVTFPFRQRLDDFNRLMRALDVKSDRHFDAVQIVVKSRAASNEKRSGNALQSQLTGEQLFKTIFNLLDCLFGIAQRK